MTRRVGLDLLFLAPGATGGMEVYARGLVPALAAQRPDARLVAFCGRELAAELRARPWCDGLEVVALPVRSDTRVARVLVEQLVEPVAFARARCDVVHSLGNTTPVAPGGAPRVVTIHDLLWMHHPETVTPVMRRGLQQLVPRAARRAARIVVPSQASRDDVVGLLGVDAGKVDVIPQGRGMAEVEPTPEADLRARLGLGDGPLVLSPAAPRPHKNLPALLRAVAGLEATVVVTGYPPTQRDELPAGARVVLPGWVSDADLEGLYRAATCLAFPSLAEGFGLPVVEAMARGLPVACSSTTSLPEVAGDAALLFDPRDEGAIREAVSRLLRDPALRESLAARGRERAATFTWEACARATWETYDRAVAA